MGGKPENQKQEKAQLKSKTLQGNILKTVGREMLLEILVSKT